MKGWKLLFLGGSVLFATALAQASPGPARAGARHSSVSAPGSLHAGFVNPPGTARPRVWWHWMNGNVTRGGIRKDLEWMQRIGIGGVQNFEASLATPQVVDKRLVYMSPEWKEVFSYAVKLADRSGMEFAIAASPGWSETGGPWVPPQDAMKKLVWASIDVDAAHPFDRPLPLPPDTAGPFQTLPPLPRPAAAFGATQAFVPPAFYADIAVLAFPIDQEGRIPVPAMSVSDGRAIEPALVADENYDSGIDVPVGDEQNPGWVRIEYPTPQTIRSVTIYIPGANGIFGARYNASLEAEADGEWHKLADLPLSAVPSTASFAPIVAQRFRLLLTHAVHEIPSFAIAAPGTAINLKTLFGPPRTVAKLAELRLSPESRIDAFEAKAGFTLVPDYYAIERPDSSNPAGVPPASVLDVSGHLRADGSLDWTPPKGKWRILRLGYSLTGATNHPATAEATGLEVDKYDGAAVGRYLDRYFDTYLSAIGPQLIGDRGVRALLTDSTEVGASNWTPGLVAQFKRLRGYDPGPWLPALAGTIIGDRDRSDRFLYDFRRTLADLVVTEHYGRIAEAAHRHGLVYYSEALESGRPTLGDDMAMRTPADLPMGAFWTHPAGTEPHPAYLADLKGAASVAHVYGKPLVAAESLTTALHPWAYGPADLKPMIDREFAAGVNRPVIHTSVHQPVDDIAPGLSLAVFGLDFNRLDSWAELAKPWIDYIARSSFLLQQGRNVADVAYFYGEEAPLVSLYYDKTVGDAPRRYAYDFVNADIVLKELSVENGDLVSRGGARYRLLYLGGTSTRMTVPVLRRLKELVDRGATIVGNAPASSPSLADDPAEFARLVADLWGGGKQARPGRVIANSDVEAALKHIQVEPDVDPGDAPSASGIVFVHRRSAEADIYFIDNPTEVAGQVDARFRVSGKVPEIWHAETGEREAISYRFDHGGTGLRLELSPHQAMFVVFQRQTSMSQLTLKQSRTSRMAAIEGPWAVAFQAGRGAPATVELPHLAPLSESPDAAIRYFSGIATYRKSIKLPAMPGRHARVFLDLGTVGDVAEVRVNSKHVGTAWTPPFRVEVSSALKPGRNELEIAVANLWMNRLIGDAQPGAEKVTGVRNSPYLPTAAVRPSGLIGPVALEFER